MRFLVWHRIAGEVRTTEERWFDPELVTGRLGDLRRRRRIVIEAGRARFVALRRALARCAGHCRGRVPLRPAGRNAPAN